MKTFLTFIGFFILLGTSNFLQAKGCSGYYYVAGIASDCFGQKIVPDTLTVRTKNSTQNIVTDKNGGYIFKIDWVIPCKSGRRKKSQTQLENSLNPKYIFIWFKGAKLTLTNQYRKYAECIPTSEDEITHRFHLNFPPPHLKDDRKMDNSAFYKKGKWKKYSNFDIEQLISLLEEYPTICIEFKQFVIENEPQKIGDKRMKHFKKLILEANCPIDRLHFSKEMITLKNGETTNNKSAISAEVVSRDGNCF